MKQRFPTRTHNTSIYVQLRCNLHWVPGCLRCTPLGGSRVRKLKMEPTSISFFDRASASADQRNFSHASTLHSLISSAMKLIDNVSRPLTNLTRSKIRRLRKHRSMLRLDGRVEPALSFLPRKSALLLQRGTYPHVENQGYIRMWIGELLSAKKDFCAALTFFQAAIAKWRMVAPQRAATAEAKIAIISDQTKDCRRLSLPDREEFVSTSLNEPDPRRLLFALR